MAGKAAIELTRKRSDRMTRRTTPRVVRSVPQTERNPDSSSSAKLAKKSHSSIESNNKTPKRKSVDNSGNNKGSAAAVTGTGLSEKDLDMELVQRVQRGDKSGFDLLVTKYQHKILNLVSRYVHDHHEAQDVAQEDGPQGHLPGR